jgi:hypothetical protein
MIYQTTWHPKVLSPDGKHTLRLTWLTRSLLEPMKAKTEASHFSLISERDREPELNVYVKGDFKSL